MLSPLVAGAQDGDQQAGGGTAFQYEPQRAQRLPRNVNHEISSYLYFPIRSWYFSPVNMVDE
jgi:hypothetical protein